MPSESPQPLSEEAITEVEAQQARAVALVDDDTEVTIAALISNVPALIQTVRAAWAKYDAEDKDHQLTIDTFQQQERIWQQKFDEQESASTALREQLAQAMAQIEELRGLNENVKNFYQEDIRQP